MLLAWFIKIGITGTEKNRIKDWSEYAKQFKEWFNPFAARSVPHTDLTAGSILHNLTATRIVC